MLIKAKIVEINQEIGYDIELLSDYATIQDYLDVLNQLIEEANLTRRYNEQKYCEGCPKCCRDRIPLTSIDALMLMQGLGITQLRDFLRDFCNVIIEGPSVDIILASSLTGECVLLESNLGKCKQYLTRSLVCQTFICCPSTERATDLRNLIVNMGEDDLVRKWFTEGRDKDGKLIIHESWDAQINEQDWTENAFTNRLNYDQIKIKDICPVDLWKKLREEGM